jgi:hypothetical protein
MEFWGIVKLQPQASFLALYKKRKPRQGAALVRSKD